MKTFLTVLMVVVAVLVAGVATAQNVPIPVPRVAPQVIQNNAAQQQMLDMQRAAAERQRKLMEGQQRANEIMQRANAAVQRVQQRAQADQTRLQQDIQKKAQEINQLKADIGAMWQKAQQEMAQIRARAAADANAARAGNF